MFLKNTLKAAQYWLPLVFLCLGTICEFAFTNHLSKSEYSKKTDRSAIASLRLANANEINLLLGSEQILLWSKDLNRNQMFVAILSRLKVLTGFQRTLNELVRVLQVVPLQWREQMATAGAREIFTTPFQWDIVCSAVLECEPIVGCEILEAYIASIAPASKSLFADFLARIENTPKWNKDTTVALQIKLLELEYTHESDLNLSESLGAIYKAKGIDIKIARCLAELKITYPARYSAFMAHLLTNDVEAFVSGFQSLQAQFPDMRLWMEQLPQAKRLELLGRVSEKMLNENPSLSLDLARTFKAQDFDADARLRVASNLIHVGGDFEHWIDSIPKSEQLKLISDVMIQERLSNRGMSGDFARRWLSIAKESSLIADFPSVESALAFARVTDIARVSEFEALVPKSDRLKLRKAIFHTFVYNALPAQISGAFQRMPSEQRVEFLSFAASTLLMTNPAFLMETLASLESSQERQAVENVIIQQGSIGIPLSQRTKMLTDRLAASPNIAKIEPVISDYLRNAVEIDPQAGASVLEQLPSGKEQEKLVSEFTKTWGESDPVALGDWIAKMKPGKMQDLALRELVNSSGDEPGSAIPNAAAIGDSAMRREAMFKILDRWKSLDSNLALDLVRKLKLPGDEMAFYVERLTGK